jgi:hypothetical protein
LPPPDPEQLFAQADALAASICPWLPSGGFGTIADFARNAGNLYELRNIADYDPSRDFTADEAELAISDAREAIAWFEAATKEQQESFLTLLLFRPR